MRLITPRRLAVCGGAAVLAALCWFAPPWAQGDSSPQADDPAGDAVQMPLTENAAAPSVPADTRAVAAMVDAPFARPVDATVDAPRGDRFVAGTPTAAYTPLGATPAADNPVADYPVAGTPIADNAAVAAPVVAVAEPTPAPVPAAVSETPAEAVALADTDNVPEASPIGGEQKILTAATRPAATDQPNANSSASSRRITRSPRAAEAISPAEWEKIDAFLAQYSPIRGTIIETQPDSPRRYNMMNSAARDYHTYLRATDEPPLASVILSRIKLEDDIFGLARQVHQASGPSLHAVEDQLRQKVVELVDTNMHERQLWLDRLKATVATQQTALDHDAARRDEIIQQRYNDIVHRAQRYFAPQPPAADGAAPPSAAAPAASRNPGDPPAAPHNPSTQPS